MDNTNELDINNQPSQVEAEKMLSQDRVNEIVKREKAAAAEKARREMQAEMAGQNQQASEMNLDDATFAKIKERLLSEFHAEQEEAQQNEKREEVKKLVDTYYENMEKGADFAPDFHSVTSDFNAPAFPQLVTLVASHGENIAPIMYELAKNPLKAANLDALARRDPAMAAKQLQLMADSIKHNMEALENHPKVNPPLNHLRPSISAGADAGKPSLQDLKKIYRG